jgi:hypothetical protein
MGLFDSISELYDSATSGLSDLFDSGSSGYQAAVGGLDFLGNNFSSFSPMNYPSQGNTPSLPVYQNTMAMTPAIGAGMAVMTRSLARFPALSSAIGALTAQFGKRFTPETVWRMVKVNGPGLVMGLIGAQAMNELAIWKTTHKSRRMNVANTKALRRSLRRLKGFDRLSHRVSAQLHRGGRRRSSSKTGLGSPQFVRQG